MQGQQQQQQVNYQPESSLSPSFSFFFLFLLSHQSLSESGGSPPVSILSMLCADHSLVYSKDNQSSVQLIV